MSDVSSFKGIYCNQNFIFMKLKLLPCLVNDLSLASVCVFCPDTAMLDSTHVTYTLYCSPITILSGHWWLDKALFYCIIHKNDYYWLQIAFGTIWIIVRGKAIGSI